MVKYDRLFMIETCPSPTDSETRKVDPIRGIKVDHILYWSDEFQHFKGNHPEVQVRIDPWDPGVAFALVDKKWVECRSKYRSLFRYLSWVELRYVINDLRKQLSVKKLPLTEARIAAHARVLVPSNFDSRLRIQQEECRIVYQSLGLAAVNGTPPEDENPFLKQDVPLPAEPQEIKALPSPSEPTAPRQTVAARGTLPPAAILPEWSFDDDFGLL